MLAELTGCESPTETSGQTSLKLVALPRRPKSLALSRQMRLPKSRLGSIGQKQVA